jgi:hypothetical protein
MSALRHERSFKIDFVNRLGVRMPIAVLTVRGAPRLLDEEQPCCPREPSLEGRVGPSVVDVELMHAVHAVQDCRREG